MKKRVLSMMFIILPIISYATCEEYLILNKEGTAPRDLAQAVVTIFKDKTKIYKIENNTIVPNGTLKFNEAYYIVKIYNKKYYGISKREGGSIIGYVDKDSVLCTEESMKEESGLLKKFFIKTSIHQQGTTETYVKAYPSSSEKDKICGKLKRFSSFYIYREENNRLLLASSERFKAGDMKLTGWVNKKNGYIWNTAIGIRPIDTLSDDTPEFFYRTVEDVRNHKNKGKILGGKRWYNIPIRIPVLDMVMIDNKKYYKVVMYADGIGVKKNSKGLYYTKQKSVKIKKSQSQVDIMFLIDGTQSMHPYIHNIVKKEGIIDKLSENLRKRMKHKGLIPRISYRIFRDAYAGDKNLGEGEAITASCGKAVTQRNFNINSLFGGKDPDYYENLYGGISQAIKDMKKCQDNKKIIFIIGDAGDKHQIKSNKFNKVLKELIKNKQHNKKIILIFIQTPINPALKDKAGYMDAYKAFKRQAEAFSKELQLTDIRTYIESNESNFVNNILENSALNDYLNYEYAQEVENGVLNGESLVDVIERLGKQEKYKKIPGILNDEMKDDNCQELGPRCKGNVYDIVVEGYIKVSDKISEDIFFLGTKFTTLNQSLNSKKDLNNKTSKVKRNRLVKLLKTILKDIAGEEIGNMGDTKIEFFLKRYGIPTRKDSPLFSNSISELKDVNKVSDKKIKLLINWVIVCKDMLMIVNENKMPKLRYKGTVLDIPQYRLPVKKEAFEKGSGYKYTDDEIEHIDYLWVPKIFLP